MAIKKRNMVLLGPPGAGKGTLSDILKGEEKLAHISTGDIIRAEIKAGTELGLKVKSIAESGQLVPDQLVADLVAKRLAEKDCANGFILDGFPRTVPQAELLDANLKKIGMKLDVVVLFEASEELLIQRLTARLTCRKCGTNFNKLFSKPKAEGVCDKCSGELYQRADDSLETAQNRLKVYNDQTSPLISYYKKAGILSSIDSAQPKDKAYPSLIAVLS